MERVIIYFFISPSKYVSIKSSTKKKKKTVEPTLKKLSLFVMGIRNKETNL